MRSLVSPDDARPASVARLVADDEDSRRRIRLQHRARAERQVRFARAAGTRVREQFDHRPTGFMGCHEDRLKNLHTTGPTPRRSRMARPMRPDAVGCRVAWQFAAHDTFRSNSASLSRNAFSDRYRALQSRPTATEPMTEPAPLVTRPKLRSTYSVCPSL